MPTTTPAAIIRLRDSTTSASVRSARTCPSRSIDMTSRSIPASLLWMPSASSRSPARGGPAHRCRKTFLPGPNWAAAVAKTIAGASVLLSSSRSYSPGLKRSNRRLGPSAGLSSLRTQGMKGMRPPAAQMAAARRQRRLRAQDEERPLHMAPIVAAESMGWSTRQPCSPGRASRFSSAQQ